MALDKKNTEENLGFKGQRSRSIGTKM